MIIEQAFHNLPEILVGSGYAKQDYKQGYEASIVGAFSLAILQELNGRNIQNPISCLIAERRYFGEEENVRADLCVELSTTFVGSKAFSSYGFRFTNWIEAKYFRKTEGTPPSNQNMSSIINDLLRLAILTPDEANKDGKGSSGRYFLHVYQGDPIANKLLTKARKRKDAADRVWIEKILTPGQHEIESFELDKEPKSIYYAIPKKFSTMTCKLSLTNYVIKPSNITEPDAYTIILTRIDAAKISYNAHEYEMFADRTINCADIKSLRQEVIKDINEDRAQKAKEIQEKKLKEAEIQKQAAQAKKAK